MSTSMCSGTSCGSDSMWRSRRWCSTTPPSLTPAASPTSTTGTSTAIFCVRDTARKSTWISVLWMWSRWISRGMARCGLPSTIRSSKTFDPPADVQQVEHLARVDRERDRLLLVAVEDRGHAAGRAELAGHAFPVVVAAFGFQLGFHDRVLEGESGFGRLSYRLTGRNDLRAVGNA